MKTLVLFSGGIDSSVLLAMAAAESGAENVLALSVFYGQKHARELAAARDIAAYYGVERQEMDLSQIFEGCSCSLLQHSDAPIPQKSYAAQIAETGGERPVSTYVPFRNGLFLSAAASAALSLGCSKIAYGAHADDAAGAAYPDCSQAFVSAMQAAISEGTGGQLALEAPFAAMTKAEVVRIGLELGVPFGLTWSCYEGGETPCGRCGTCRDRAAAFQANGAADPLLEKGANG